MSFEQDDTAPAEAGFNDFETKLQYEKNDIIPFIVDQTMMDMTVDALKEGLLHLEPLSYVREKPEELSLFLMLPPERQGEPEVMKKLEGDRVMWYYMNDITRSSMFKLLVTRLCQARS